ncbi:spermidine synthase [Patescibacteria group bacterium]
MIKIFNKIWLIVALLINGAAIIIIEILGTRIIAPYFGTTLYVWTALIVITLLALALGYFFGGKLADKKPDWKIFYSLFLIASLLFILIPLVDGWILNLTGSLGIMWGPLVAALLLFFLVLGVQGMITPFAVRLNVDEIKWTGRTVGSIYAISTVGSIIGAVIVAYLLIPNFGISTILISTAVILFLISAIWFLANKSGSGTVISALLIGAALVLIQPSTQADANVLETTQSFYGNITVEKLSTDLTCLSVNNIPQSCYNANLDGSAFYYPDLMVRGLEQIDNPKKVLVIGDGSGLISREILKKYQDIQIDAVDIDEKIFDLGKQYLHFKDSSQVNKIVADGRQFLRDSAGGYDAILIDAYTDSSPVLHLYTKEMFELAKMKMTDQGVLVVNSFGFSREQGSEAIKSLAKTLALVFNSNYITSSGQASGETRGYFNFVHYAGQRELKKIGLAFEFETSDGAEMISDSFNPLEYMSLPASAELINLYVTEDI